MAGVGRGQALSPTPSASAPQATVGCPVSRRLNVAGQGSSFPPWPWHCWCDWTELGPGLSAFRERYDLNAGVGGCREPAGSRPSGYRGLVPGTRQGGPCWLGQTSLPTAFRRAIHPSPTLPGNLWKAGGSNCWPGARQQMTQVSWGS